MATNYPGSLDDFATTSPSNLGDDDSKGRTHSERHNDMESAMEAVQAELGTDPAGGAATVKARLDAIARASFAMNWPKTGFYYMQPYEMSASGASLTANRLYYQPFYCPSAVTLSALAVRVSGTLTSAVRLGIYSATVGSSGMVPDALVVDAGTADTSTAGYKEVATTQALSADTWYFLAVVSDAAVNLIAAATTGSQPGAVESSGTAVHSGSIYESHTYGSLPSPGGTYTYNTATQPAVAVKL